MAIQVGETMPSGVFGVMTDAGPGAMSTDELFSGKKVVLVSVPGAFTPTCSAKHLPGFVEHVDAILAKGVDTVAFTAVNDVFVMHAWGRDSGVGDKIMMLADGNADFTRAIGLEVDRSDVGMGLRSQRYSMLIDDGVVQQLYLEEPGDFSVSDAETMLNGL